MAYDARMEGGQDTVSDPARWLAEHGDALYRFAMARVGNRALAEDLLQETLIAAMTATKAFEGGSSERTWLIGILKHKVIDHYRRAARETPFDADLAEDDDPLAGRFKARDGHWAEPPREWGEPGRVLENDRLGAALSACIEALPERLRAAFVLRELDGLETDEIVTTLGISTSNNLFVMLSRSRERLRQCLEQKWFAS